MGVDRRLSAGGGLHEAEPGEKRIQSTLWWLWKSQYVFTFNPPPFVLCCCGTSRVRTRDRGCTCTVIFISRPQLLHITTVGVHKAKARMNPPANSHRRTESVWGGWEPTGMQRWLRMQCTAIYIYIYIYRIYTKQQWDPNKTPDISFYTNTERRRTNFFFFP